MPTWSDAAKMMIPIHIDDIHSPPSKVKDQYNTTLYYGDVPNKTKTKKSSSSPGSFSVADVYPKELEKFIHHNFKRNSVFYSDVHKSNGDKIQLMINPMKIKKGGNNGKSTRGRITRKHRNKSHKTKK